ncbi:HDOD domain-containing protein [Undibacterium sp. TC9W]|uniref:HDOD domain-containing protein n=1 Tax=Undibacterium sp. TC9W TaxID=3413053 RepID=UPI003BF34238
MLGLLRSLWRRLGIGSAADAEALQAATVFSAPEDIVAEEGAWQAGFDVDSRFYPWLLGAYGKQVQHGADKPLLIALERLVRADFSDARHIPRVPSVLPQLLKSLRNENVSGDELASHIGRDVSLVAEIISEVNSSYYSPADKISSLDNAIRLLGINGLRLLVARTAFRPLIQLQSGRITCVVAPLIWEQSEKCAQACRLLAQERGLDGFHAYLTGLVQNIGLIIAFRSLDQIMVAPVMPLATEFRLRFLHMAHILSYRIAKEWDFPDAVMQALKDQVSHDGPLQDLGLVLKQAGDISKIRLLVNAAVISDDDEDLRLAADAEMQRCFTALHVQEKDEA